jgi:hypothetical protein
MWYDAGFLRAGASSRPVARELGLSRYAVSNYLIAWAPVRRRFLATGRTDRGSRDLPAPFEAGAGLLEDLSNLLCHHAAADRLLGR